ncbi:MAG: SprB repeat-containing protein [Flavobacteriales bacterium]|nr:SprB repeat-containing protein [Flavobacteriales bacterium]
MRTWIIILLVAFLPLSAAALQVNGNISQPNCGLANGSVNAYASGGQAPYTWVWSPAPATGQGTSQITGLLPGTWTATVTDNLGEQATHDFILNNIQSITNTRWGHMGLQHERGASSLSRLSEWLYCSGTSILNGTPEPFTVNGSAAQYFPIDANWGFLHFDVWANSGAQVQYSIMDGNGCAGFARPPCLASTIAGARAHRRSTAAVGPRA